MKILGLFDERLVVFMVFKIYFYSTYFIAKYMQEEALSI